MSLLAQIFEEENALDQLALFASQNGPAFYRLPVNEDVLRLAKRDAPVSFPDTRDSGA